MNIISDRDQLVFEYVNWQGEKNIRKVKPHRIWYGSTQWHPNPQWLLEATDIEKQEIRNFALKDIQKIW